MITAQSGGVLNAIPLGHCSFFHVNALSIDLSWHVNYRALLLNFYEKIPFSAFDISRSPSLIVPSKE
jgi:hypothetical protein